MMMAQDTLHASPSGIASMFSVPVAQAHLAGSAALNAELRALFLSRENHPSVRNPHPSLRQQAGVYESDFTLFSWPDACVRTLRDFCWQELGRTVQDLNQYDAEEMRRLQIYSHTWFHITRYGGFVINHTHPMASWSGVYCVNPGKNPGDRPESGVLRFHNPHHYSNNFLDAGNSRLRPPFHHGSWSFNLQAGQLILFPSWLPHEVLPFYGDDERITVAFNCWFAHRTD